MESQSLRKEPRKIYSNDFKLRIVELASRPDACVAQIARENGVNVLFEQGALHTSQRLTFFTETLLTNQFQHFFQKLDALIFGL
ncbi:transposase [Salmonella enterica subsp. enterica serovar Java]|uniref:Transposase n=4 Tax=Salmonella enterica TaxID=28901 RepID=A0A3R0U2C8_SALER|nr:transposase [Salmonella enterica subsp. enterica serovar Java]EAO1480924.1 transposase [Salmonella enterica]ECA3791104.1 transposase [Salmonella enterica subsp. enterica serovar Aqua]HBM0100002.1 transposase [Salmonella enterica subsp. enterica serovar Wedding]ECH1168690.1 transposase [Salmonella enterica subsp. enterica serovar Aqua]